MDNRVLEVNNVSFSYENEHVLDNINMTVNKGDFICILGQSGCGKSTLLRLLASLEKPASGSIFFNGQVLDKPRIDIGVVFQDYSLFPWLKTGDNLLLALKQKYKEKSTEELKNKIYEFMDKVGLSSKIYVKYPNELSGGMRQRCAICRALLLDPPLLLMDEPFGALDAITRAKLQDLTLELWNNEGRDKKTIVFVTHDIDEALYLATKIYVLKSSPSKVIYEAEFNKDAIKTREEIFNDEKIMVEKNRIMKVLQNDIQKRIKEDKGNEKI